MLWNLCRINHLLSNKDKLQHCVSVTLPSVFISTYHQRYPKRLWFLPSFLNEWRCQSLDSWSKLRFFFNFSGKLLIHQCRLLLYPVLKSNKRYKMFKHVYGEIFSKKILYLIAAQMLLGMEHYEEIIQQ